MDDTGNIGTKALDSIKPNLEFEFKNGSPQRLYLVEEDELMAQDAVYLYFVNESNMENCPQIEILIGNQTCTALIDTGCQCSVMSEKFYNDLKTNGLNCMELPVQNIILQSAFSNKKARVRLQTLIELNCSGILSDQVFLISAQLVTDILLGMDYCISNQVIIDFPRRKLILKGDEEGNKSEVAFVHVGQAENATADKPEVRGNDLGTSRPISQQKQGGEVPYPDHPTRSHVLSSEGFFDASMFPFLSYVGRIIYGDDVDITSCESADEDSYENTVQSRENADVCDDSKSMVNRGKYSQNKDVDEVCKHVDAEYVNGEYVRHVNLVTNNLEGLCNQKGESDTIVTSNSYMKNPGRGEAGCELTLERLSVEEKLTHNQIQQLLELLNKYKLYFTKRPGKCKVFEYKFEMQGELPKSRNSRAIPFSLRREVRDQIQEMLRHGILERSYSSYVNPLTLVERKDKPIRICLDARQVNKFMITDKTKVMPIQELLQKFHKATDQ